MHRVLLASFIALTACRSGGADAQTAPDSMHEAYLAIGSKLAADSIDDLDKLGAAVVATAAPHNTEPGVTDVVAGAGRVAAQDIATARNAFKKMSDGMIQYLVAHPEHRADLQLVHCTMTFEGNGGHWVQAKGKVMNPYEGAMMLHCGDVVSWDQAPKT